MQLAQILSITSAALGLLGSLLLAVSLDRPLMMLRAHAEALDITVQALVDRRSKSVPVCLNFSKLHSSSFSRGNLRVKLGCGLLVVAFLLQLVGAFT